MHLLGTQIYVWFARTLYVGLEIDKNKINVLLSSPVGCWYSIHRAVSCAGAYSVGWWSVVSTERWSLLWAVGPRPWSLEQLTYEHEQKLVWNVFFSLSPLLDKKKSLHG